MARARNIKPGFFFNEDLAALGAEAMLLFAGLWCIADREGRLDDRPARIKAQILPYFDVDIDNLLDLLSTHPEKEKDKFIVRYQFEGMGYIQITNFLKHQNPHKNEAQSIIPAMHSKSTVQAPEINNTNRADSLNTYSLNTDSFNPNMGDRKSTPVEIFPGLDEGEGARPQKAGKGADDYLPEFEEFWNLYPRRKEKKSAFRCWKTRLKEGHQPRELITAARLYADECRRKGTQEEFIKQAKTFIGSNKPFLDYKEVDKSANDFKPYRGDDPGEFRPYRG